MRPSWIEIDLAAIEHNAREIAAHISPAALCAVVKADAYGHGDIPVAEAAIAGGATYLAVALVEEGVRLREADIDVPILVLSEPTIDEVEPIVRHGLTPTAYRLSFVDQLAESAERATTIPYPVHLKLDTGMHRVGVASPEALDIAVRIENDPRLVLQGVYTHFPSADSDPDFTLRQNDQLGAFVALLGSSGIRPRLLHAANTAAAFEMPDTRYDLCRVGLGLYGLRPAPGYGADIDLRPAMRVVSHVGYLQRLPAGSRPSYGRRRALRAPSTIATVPIGYADGVPRSLTDTATVLIHGKRYPYAGTVTMDMVMIDLGDDIVEVGDEVVFLGAQGGEEVSVDEWAEMLGTISWEVVCHFGPRLSRRYIGGSGAS